jgi:hypothetical protein
LENILHYNDYTVTGINIQNGGTYCTQTFGLKGKGDESGPKCAPLGGGSSPSSDSPTSAPTTKAVTNAKTTKASIYAQHLGEQALSDNQSSRSITDGLIQARGRPFVAEPTAAPQADNSSDCARRASCDMADGRTGLSAMEIFFASDGAFTVRLAHHRLTSDFSSIVFQSFRSFHTKGTRQAWRLNQFHVVPFVSKS